jgi:hypothetical protein
MYPGSKSETKLKHPECTAIETGRPLLALTIADIGTKEETMETKLSYWFYLAERWKAVLLIDEADIFLERRKHTDLARNGIVSGECPLLSKHHELH